MALSEYQKKLALIRTGDLPKTTGPKEKQPLRRVSKAKAAADKLEKEARGNEDSGLDKYFEHHMKSASPICMNCGMEARWLLQEEYKFIWRSCQAHVLPKKDGIGGFPSVASNLLNHLVLFPHFGGLCNCHGRFDSSYEEMVKMKVFPQAIDIINRLYPLIAADEKKYLPEIIIQEIKPSVYGSTSK